MLFNGGKRGPCVSSSENKVAISDVFVLFAIWDQYTVQKRVQLGGICHLDSHIETCIKHSISKTRAYPQSKAASTNSDRLRDCCERQYMSQLYGLFGLS
jgi:hypothetical protein